MNKKKFVVMVLIGITLLTGCSYNIPMIKKRGNDI